MSDTTTSTPQPVAFLHGQTVYVAHEYTGDMWQHIVNGFDGTTVTFLCDPAGFHRDYVSHATTATDVQNCETCADLAKSHGNIGQRTQAAAAGPGLMEILPQRDYEPVDDYVFDSDVWLAADLLRPGMGTVRVVVTDEITVYAFDPNLVVRYSVRFAPSTPDAVIVAALDQIEREALGLGHVYTVVVSDETGRSVYSNKTRATSVHRALGFAWSCTTE